MAPSLYSSNLTLKQAADALAQRAVARGHTKSALAPWAAGGLAGAGVGGLGGYLFNKLRKREEGEEEDSGLGDALRGALIGGGLGVGGGMAYQGWKGMRAGPGGEAEKKLNEIAKHTSPPSLSDEVSGDISDKIKSTLGVAWDVAPKTGLGVTLGGHQLATLYPRIQQWRLNRMLDKGNAPADAAFFKRLATDLKSTLHSTVTDAGTKTYIQKILRTSQNNPRTTNNMFNELYATGHSADRGALRRAQEATAQQPIDVAAMKNIAKHQQGVAGGLAANTPKGLNAAAKLNAKSQAAMLDLIAQRAGKNVGVSEVGDLLKSQWVEAVRAHAKANPEDMLRLGRKGQIVAEAPLYSRMLPKGSWGKGGLAVGATLGTQWLANRLFGLNNSFDTAPGGGSGTFW